MPLSSEQADRYFQALTDKMRSLGLTWAVDQVLEDIGRGKEQVVRFKRTKNKEQEFLPFRPVTDELKETKMRKELAARTIEYSAQERLEILLTAVQRAIVNTSEMQEELVKHYGPILFIPEQDQPERNREFGVRADRQLEAVQKLAKLIAELKSQLR